MKLGLVLRKYRAMSEITLRTLAKEIGISAATLWRIEKGKDADGRTIGKILTWLFKDTAKWN